MEKLRPFINKESERDKHFETINLGFIFGDKQIETGMSYKKKKKGRMPKAGAEI